jgi:hypothetical protein
MNNLLLMAAHQLGLFDFYCAVSSWEKFQSLTLTVRLGSLISYLPHFRIVSKLQRGRMLAWLFHTNGDTVCFQYFS